MERLTRGEVLRHAEEIAEEYTSDGMKLTVRQLYYQFVRRDLWESGQLEYKRLVSVLSDARVEGTFPMDVIEDRGRDVGKTDTLSEVTSEEDALDTAKYFLSRISTDAVQVPRWSRQRTNVSVWVEKDALSGVLEPICKDLGVGFFACKGYPSVSALHDWAEHTATQAESVDEVVVLYLGDHDPDGWEIPRSAVRTIETMQDNNVVPSFSFKLERIALNMDQIRRYSPPPFEAKVTSARFARYFQEHNTTDAWELDALDPRQLRDLVRTEVMARFDRVVLDEVKAEGARVRAVVRDSLLDAEWMSDALSEI